MRPGGSMPHSQGLSKNQNKTVIRFKNMMNTRPHELGLLSLQ